MANLSPRMIWRRDVAKIKSWAIASGQEFPNNVSEHGFIVDDVAAVFVYPSSNYVAFIDDAVINPEVDHDLGKQCLNRCIEESISTLEFAGFIRIKNNTLKEV